MDLEAPREPYDIVCLWDTLDCIPRPDALLEKIRRELRPGGTLAITIPDLVSVFAGLQGKYYRLVDPATRFHYFSPASAKALLRRAGFQAVTVTHTAFRRIHLPFGLGIPVNLGDSMFITATA